VYCSNCGKKLLSGQGKCSKCGAQMHIHKDQLSETLYSSAWMPFIAGFILLFASIECIRVGIDLSNYFSHGIAYLNWREALYIIAAVFGFVGFIFGLIGSINMFKRENFGLAFNGSIGVAVYGLFLSLLSERTSGILILAILALIFLVMSKSEFNPATRSGRALIAGISSQFEKPQTNVEKIKELKKLMDDGIITEKEFQAKKRDLLEQY
jgi:hypothetical protein